MATRLHLLTINEQYRARQRRRTNLRLLFVAAFAAVVAFCIGAMVA
jgi:hypothetical protein